jgi:transcriptional regulator with XRE-family HTH domain
MSERKIPKVNLLKLRQKAGFSQLEMSQLLGVTENTYANWETGRSGLNWITMVVNLCKLFDCDEIDLLEYKNTKNKGNE